MMIPTLVVDGNEYGGWTGLRASASIERAAGAFQLEVTDPWLPDVLMPIRPGLRCLLRLGPEVVVTGWVDAVTRDLGPRAHTVQVSGRDATADLVDCSAKVKEYNNQTLLEIARHQVSEGGWDMKVELAPGSSVGAPFVRERVEPGQSVFEFLERLARHRGVLLMPDGKGNLLIGSPGMSPSPRQLIENRNLLGIRACADWRERFSEYEIRGQTGGSEERNGKEAAHLRATAKDQDVGYSRRRLKIMSAEDGEVDLQARAQWECQVAIGRSLTVQAGVQGWCADPADPATLWRAGQTVRIEAPTVGVSETLLIVTATYNLSERGTTTDLDLTRPAAWAPPAPTPDKPADANASGWWA